MASLNNKFKQSIRDYQNTESETFHSMDNFVEDVKYFLEVEELSNSELDIAYSYFRQDRSATEAADKISGGIIA